jgi:hypothetical protein
LTLRRAGGRRRKTSKGRKRRSLQRTRFRRYAAFSCAKAEIGTGSKAAATKADAVDFSADTVRDPVHQLAATNE